MERPLRNNTTAELLKSFEEWAASAAHSSRFIDFYKALLKNQADAEYRIGLPGVHASLSELNRRILGGKPLLTAGEIDIDWPLVNDLFNEVAELFSQYPEILELPSGLAETRIELTPGLLEAWFNRQTLPGQISGIEIDPFALSTLIHHTVRPYLTGYAMVFKGSFDQEFWRRNTCPVCGSTPSFAYLEKELGARYLVCSCCGANWLFQRLDCVFCRNTEHSSLSFWTDENGIYRLYLCEKCRHYLKAIDLRKTEGEVNLPLEAITSVDMDNQAEQLGYYPGS